MGKSDRVKKFERLKRLIGYFAQLGQVKALVIIFFNEVVKTLSQGLKYKARVFHLVLGVDEVILQFDDIVVAASFLLDVCQNGRLDLGAVSVALNCPNDFDRDRLLCVCLLALESPAKSAVTQVTLN